MFVYRQGYNSALPVSIPILVQSNNIVFECLVPNARPNWNRSGNLTRQFLMPAIGFTKEPPITLALGKTLLNFQDYGDYYLRFEPFTWIINFQISIWELP